MISQYKYEKDPIYYNDMYDRHTVEMGRLKDKISSKKKYKNKIKNEWAKVVHQVSMEFWKGERFRNKSETINAWISEDRRKDKLLNEAKPHRGVHCLLCNSILECTDKTLVDWKDKEDIIFMYECPSCNSRRAFYKDGTEFHSKKKPCLKCGCNDYKIVFKETKTKEYTIRKCTKCGDTKQEYVSEKPKPDKNYLEDREKYCMTEEEGMEYIESAIKLEQCSRLFDKEKS